MKNIKKYIRILIVLVMIVPLIGVTKIYATDNKSLDDIKIDATNYNQYREQLELNANGSNVINRTLSQTYKFGTYATTQIDGWNVTVLSNEVGTDGYHTIKFKANEGYKLPAAVASGDTRFARVSVSYISGQKYTVENNVGILKFKPQLDMFNKISNYISPNVVYTHLVGIPQDIAEKDYLIDYVFVEVQHQGQDVNDSLGRAGIAPIVKGSRTYLVKKNQPLKVYYMNQEHMKPIETQPSTTGVSYEHDDYKNRYCVIPGSKTDTTNRTLAYDTTIFSVFVYSYTKAQWERLNSYDFYYEDNTIQLPAYDNEKIASPNLRVVGFGVQQLMYQSHMAYNPKWENFNTGLEYTWTTKASDYNVQWVSTGVDGGNDSYRHSSLRHRFGDIYLTPIYQNEYTVRFLNYDGTVLDAQKVLKGKDAIAPTNPLRENYTFEAWDKEYTNIQGNLDIHATYKQNTAPVEPDITKVKVKFLDYDGTVLKEESLNKGASATAPISPQRAGYKFVGWDKEFTNLQEDLTVYALYEVENEVALPTPPTITGPEAPIVTEVPINTIINVIPVARGDIQTNIVQNTPQANENVIIDNQDIPQGNGDKIIEDNQTPLAKIDGAWALINLICVVLVFIMGIILIVSKHKDEEDKKDLQSDYEHVEYKRRRWTKIFSIIIAIISIVVFVFTENITLPMQFIDKYTLVMLALLVIQSVVLFVGYRLKKDKTEKFQTNEG